MAHGHWEDFTDKYGFDDGEMVGEVDIQARNRIVAILNEELKGRGITALAWDRAGLHNYCLLLVLPNPKTEKPEKLLEQWLRQQIKEVPLPDDIAARTEEIVAKAYEHVGRT